MRFDSGGVPARSPQAITGEKDEIHCHKQLMTTGNFFPHSHRMMLDDVFFLKTHRYCISIINVKNLSDAGELTVTLQHN